MSQDERKLGFFATPEHDCNYLSDEKATTLFADPSFPKNKRLHSALSSIGFRRSGEHLYQPHCEQCSACISVRIPVDEFRQNRGQRRNWKRNGDIEIQQRPPVFEQDHFDLYKRYQHERHLGGGMESHSPETYMEFLSCQWAETVFFEFSVQDKLTAVAIVDVLDHGLSAVYTFFEPSEHKRSLGRYAILFEIELTRRLGLKYLYLGYWIEQCRKMSYKTEYQPLEYFINNEWRPSDNSKK